MATAKHFPGHGDTAVDSHLDLPIVPHARERLEAVEFRPFREVSGEVAALMTAHVAVAPMGMTPATLSPALLEGIVRREWGFEGIIFTDSLAMAAVAEHLGSARAGVLALLAGADVLLALGGEEVLAEVFGAVRQAVADGILSAARLERSFHRLERFRERMARAAAGQRAGGEAGEGEARQFGAEVAAAAVTLVRNENGLVPLKDSPVRVVTLAPAGETGPTLGRMLSGRRPDVDEIRLDPREGAFQGNSGIPTVVVTHSRGTPDPRQVDLVRAAHRLVGDRLIVVATGTPYDLAAFPEVSCYVATYGREPVMLEAAARLLAGEISPHGLLPVAIPTCHPAGWGVVW
jgi:beta-N-acetylhexosaminidase